MFVCDVDYSKTYYPEWSKMIPFFWFLQIGENFPRPIAQRYVGRCSFFSQPTAERAIGRIFIIFLDEFFIFLRLLFLFY